MDIAETVKFKDVCQMLERIKTAKKSENKEKYLRRYYESFLKHRENFRREQGIAKEEETGLSSFYCILRCLIPNADLSRKPYGLQITSLGKVYIKILQIPEDSREAERLHARSYSGATGDYADIVYSVLQPRCTHEGSQLNMRQVHELLDTIAADDRKNTEKVLTRLSEVTSAQEQKWFIRLLLKSMHLGIGEQKVFGLLHPQAKELYQRCSNLSRVCCMLTNSNISQEPTTSAANGLPSVSGDRYNLNQAIAPFHFIRPMLCEIFPGNIEPLMAADVLYLETKMDGERFQLHYLDGRFKYISRNGNDYTYSFGESYESGRLTPQLENLLPIGMESIIIDGEMMIWDTAQSRFRDKGENTDVKHLNRHGTWRPCFVAYDLLYFNGGSLLDMTYVQRKHILSELIKEEPGVLQLMKGKKVTSMENFKTMFQHALDSKEEGVVLKQQGAVYRPGVRNGGGWYKIKADYIEGLTTEFDLLIIGGFFNRERTFIASFLLGVLKFESPRKYEVYSVGKVANVSRQRVVLNAALKPHWHDVQREPPPMWYHYNSASLEGRPDVWIDPRHSSILQIKVADLNPSSAFALSKSLHFPRVEAWRNDKVWHECVTLQEYMEMSQGKKGIKKINKRALLMEDLTTSRAQFKLTAAAKRKRGLESYAKLFDINAIQQTSSLFEGFSFCILSGFLQRGTTPEELKALAVENGGKIVANPLYDDPKCINVAGDITFLVECLKKRRLCNIISVKWLVRTCRQQEIYLGPKDMICITDELQEQFSHLYDQFGDSYTEKVTVKKLKQILDDITEEELIANAPTAAEISALETALYKDKSLNYFSGLKGCFYQRDRSSQMAKFLFQWHDGHLVDIARENFGHVDFIFINWIVTEKLVFKKWLENNLKAMERGVQIVNIDWILHSDTAGRRLDMLEYTWHEL